MKITFGDASAAKEQTIKETPYYNAVAGAEIMDLLSQLLKEKDADIPRPVLLFYKDSNLRPKSMLMKINNSWKWINENADKDGRYKHLRKSVSVSLEREALAIRWKNPGATATLEAHLAAGTTDWKKQIQDWLGSDSEETFELKNLALSDEDIGWLHGLLDSAEVRFSVIDRETLRAVKPFNVS